MKHYTVEIYKLDVLNQTFLPVDEIITFQDLKWTAQKNGVGSCSFGLDIDDPKATLTNLQRFINHIAVKEYKDDIDNIGTVRFFGPITKISGGFSNVSGNLAIEANSPLYHFMARYTNPDTSFTSARMADIMWNLIDFTQDQANGWLGISQGAIAANTPIRDRDYPSSVIGQELIALSNVVDGVDFSFDPVVSSQGKVTGVQFNTYYPSIGTQRNDLLPLEIGQNIDSVNFNTAGEIFNYVNGVGGGSGESVITSLKLSSGSMLGSTRREEYYNNKDILDQTVLDDETEGELNRVAVDGYEIKVVMSPSKLPLYGTYIPGDFLRLNIVHGFMNFTYLAMVKEIAVSLDKQGVAKIEPTLVII